MSATCIFLGKVKCNFFMKHKELKHMSQVRTIEDKELNANVNLFGNKSHNKATYFLKKTTLIIKIYKYNCNVRDENIVMQFFSVFLCFKFCVKVTFHFLRFLTISNYFLFLEKIYLL